MAVGTKADRLRRKKQMKKPGYSTIETENACEIFDAILKEEVLLPDFQRGFVWDEDMKIALSASVLTKLPVGSLLMLEAYIDEYAFRKIGKKQMIDVSGKNQDVTVHSLLDGQQRITTLVNVFSDFMIDNQVGFYDLIKSNTLYRRYFLKIPYYNDRYEEKDIYGINCLKFPFDVEKEFPKFEAEDVKKYIESVKITGNEKCLKNIQEVRTNEVMQYCTENYKSKDEKKYFLVPLYYLHKACKDKNSNAYKIIDKDIRKNFSKLF